MKPKPFSKEQENFIRENYKEKKDVELAKELGVNDWVVLRFRVENKLFKERKHSPRRVNTSDMFVVTERENWLV